MNRTPKNFFIGKKITDGSRSHSAVFSSNCPHDCKLDFHGVTTNSKNEVTVYKTKDENMTFSSTFNNENAFKLSLCAKGENCQRKIWENGHVTSLLKDKLKVKMEKKGYEAYKLEEGFGQNENKDCHFIKAP